LPIIWAIIQNLCGISPKKRAINSSAANLPHAHNPNSPELPAKVYTLKFGTDLPKGIKLWGPVSKRQKEFHKGKKHHGQPCVSPCGKAIKEEAAP